LPAQASERHDAFFTGPYERRVLPRVGHNPPKEAPQAFADAVLQLIRATKR
jgi:pimeloyl-ACP methyl ester carboxylesterase